MIATPQEDDLEETENVTVERQWEEQMRYQIVLHGKAFPIGGVMCVTGNCENFELMLAPSVSG